MRVKVHLLLHADVSRCAGIFSSIVFLSDIVGNASGPRENNVHDSQASIIKAAFVILVSPGSRSEVVSCLSLLYTNVLRYNPRRIILFYGDDMSNNELIALQDTLPRHVFEVTTFLLLTNFTKVPENVQTNGVQNVAFTKNMYGADKWPGYQNMCRFMVIGILQQPIIRDLDYYCRLVVNPPLNMNDITCQGFE